VQAAKPLIDATAMPLCEVAFAAGFRSLRRFNGAFRATYGRAPSSLPRGGSAYVKRTGLEIHSAAAEASIGKDT
jgi:methylphosphotriester-DNA--protein-cysteine methyltransferase